MLHKIRENQKRSALIRHAVMIDMLSVLRLRVGSRRPGVDTLVGTIGVAMVERQRAQDHHPASSIIIQSRCAEKFTRPPLHWCF